MRDCPAGWNFWVAFGLVAVRPEDLDAWMFIEVEGPNGMESVNHS